MFNVCIKNRVVVVPIADERLRDDLNAHAGLCNQTAILAPSFCRCVMKTTRIVFVRWVALAKGGRGWGGTRRVLGTGTCSS